MIKLKDTLGEDFEGGYGGNRTRSKFYKGSIHNDEPFDFRDDKPARVNTPVSPEWDALMDRVNSDPRFKTETDGETYQITDTRGSNLVWQLYRSKSGLSWKGIGRASAKYPHPRQFNDVDELIKNFYEVTGLQPDSAVIESEDRWQDNDGDGKWYEKGDDVAESVIAEEEYKVAGRPVTLIKHGTEDQTKWEVKFQNGTVKQYADVISLIKPRPKLQEPRWQDSDGDGKWYEKGDDVKESTLAENMRRFGTKNING